MSSVRRGRESSIATVTEPEAPEADFLLRNVVDALPEGALERQLAEGRPLRVKLGIDPTAPDIHLGFNDHVRHHLVHFPDPVVRPGGMSFGTGHNTTVPQTDNDRLFFEPDQMALTIAAESARVKLDAVCAATLSASGARMCVR